MKMTSILINHKVYHKDDFEDIDHLILPDTPAFMQDIFRFLHQWFDASDSIAVNTSGSTGIPKKILLPKQVMRHSAQATLQFFNLKASDPILLCLSANYIAGKMMIVRALEGGLSLFAIEPATVINIPTDLSFRFCAMVPMQVEETLGQKGASFFDLIDQLIIGGAPISTSLEQKLQVLKTHCYATYGMTETASHVALKCLNTQNAINSFKALPGVRFEQDQRGCLIIDAPLLSPQPLITNDIVELKSDSQFIWLGRYDFVVNSGGIKLYPEMIEKKLESVLEMPFYVSKRSSSRMGEELVLIIEGEPLNNEEEKQLFDRIISVLSKFEKPRAIYYQDSFEYTTTGKLLRKTFS